ncbi:unnamed protein product, partial [Ectocarpus sp. 4 AP-2014]
SLVADGFDSLTPAAGVPERGGVVVTEEREEASRRVYEYSHRKPLPAPATPRSTVSPTRRYFWAPAVTLVAPPPPPVRVVSRAAAAAFAAGEAARFPLGEVEARAATADFFPTGDGRAFLR